MILLGSLVWYQTDFLLAKLPHLAAILDKRAATNAQQARVAWLQQQTQALPGLVGRLCGVNKWHCCGWDLWHWLNRQYKVML